MRIVIAGAGEVGSHLAKLLSKENQDIVVLSRDQAKLDYLDSRYNLMAMQGSANSFDSLRQAGVDRGCDLFIGVTPYENENLVACQIAKQLGARKTVARIDNYEFLKPENREFFNKIGVDHLIYPEWLAAKEIIVALHRPWVRNWLELHDGELILIGVKVRENARLVGKQMRDITYTQHNYHIAAIKRRSETIIPRGDDEVKAGDILYFVTTRPYVDEIRDICGKREFRVRNVMVMGGGRISVFLARLAQGRFGVTIMENDPEVVRRLPQKCDGTDAKIIRGDARNNETLIEEGIRTMDTFVALSESSESNILSCLTAKEFGVSKTIAEVENIQFIAEAEGLNIGTIINKKLIASSKIFQILLDADDSSAKFLALADAEVAELEAHEGSKITRAPVMDLKLGRDMTLGGLIRDGRGMLIGGRTQIQAGDHVLVFCLSGQIHKIEKLFN